MEQKVDPYMREAPWVCCPMCDEDVCVGRFNCPEIEEWCRENERRTRRKELCERERECAGAKRADGHRPQDR